MIKFDATKEEIQIIHKIAIRTVTMAKEELGIEYDLMTAQMDVTACHANGNPLKLKELLKADDENFAHDVFGIRRYIDRETGELQNFFSPRYSA